MMIITIDEKCRVVAALEIEEEAEEMITIIPKGVAIIILCVKDIITKIIKIKMDTLTIGKVNYLVSMRTTIMKQMTEATLIFQQLKVTTVTNILESHKIIKLHPGNRRE